MRLFGLILGSLNMVLKQLNLKKITLIHVIIFLLTFSFSIFLITLEKSLDFSFTTNSNAYLIIAGFFMSLGIVIPGISKTVILMMLGIYPMYLSALSSFDLSFLFPVGIGLIIGGFIFLVFINFLFKYAKSYTYSGIIGFIISSVFVIYPGFNFNNQGIIAILSFIICFILGIKISNI